METYYKFYFNSYLDGSDDTAAFVIITDGDRYGIAFSEEMEEENIKPMSMAIGARISAATREGNTLSPGEILNFIPYNMMLINASEEDDIYPSWKEASDAAEIALTAFSHKATGWDFKLHEPIFPKPLDNDNKTEEKK